ncbi:MAG: NAD(P)/FAD-dependent oxidoreductase [Candidatus Nanopelagicales bacterium]
MSDVTSVVVIGGGLAGAKTVEALREKGYAGALTLIGDEPHLPYERPPLSKDYLQGKAERSSVFVHDEQWYADHDVALLRGSRATAIHRASRTVALAGGTELPYDRLVLATGSSPRTLDVAGSELDGLHYLRALEDSDRLRDVLDVVQRIVVVGGGWIGLEVAAAARMAGIDVTLVEQAPLPLAGVLGPEVAPILAEVHRGHGVDLRTGVGVAALTGDDGRVVAVQLDDGTAVAAEAVVVGVGITPNVQLASDAGLDVDNGVLVDEHLRTSDPDIYAVGDVANAWHPLLGRRIRVEHWATALNQPPVAAAGVLGEDASYERSPYFFSDQYELGLEYTGYAAPGSYDGVVIRGDRSKPELIAFWTAQGVVQAGMNVNVWDVTDDIKALIASRTPIDPNRLADPTIPLKDLL